MESNVLRTHDKDLYLKENRYREPKEIFKILARLSIESGALQKDAVVCDFGCAAGEFLYYLRREAPIAKYYGYDVIPELLDKAREVVPEIKFQLGSVLDPSLIMSSSIDVAYLIGVHSIFDEFETCFGNLLSWTKKGGRIYIFGLFNPFPVDVWVKYRPVTDPEPAHREPGWNVFSKASVSRYLDEHLEQRTYRFIPFEMPFDLPPNPDDPVRTWTFRTADNHRLFTNGLSLIVNLELLEIQR